MEMRRANPDDRPIWRTLLDSQARRVLSTGDNNVLAPVLDSYIAVGVHDRKVPAVEKATLERLLCCLRVVEVLQFFISHASTHCY